MDSERWEGEEEGRKRKAARVLRGKVESVLA